MLTEGQRAALSARLRRGREVSGDRISPRREGAARMPMSFAQEQLWVIDPKSVPPTIVTPARCARRALCLATSNRSAIFVRFSASLNLGMAACHKAPRRSQSRPFAAASTQGS
jgi:hypothetical protein